MHDGTRVAIVHAGDCWSQCGHPVAVVNLDTGNWAMAGHRIARIVTGKPAARLLALAMWVPFAIATLALVVGASGLAWIALGLAVVIAPAWFGQGGSALANLKKAVAPRIRAHAQALASRR